MFVPIAIEILMQKKLNDFSLNQLFLFSTIHSHQVIPYDLKSKRYRFSSSFVELHPLPSHSFSNKLVVIGHFKKIVWSPLFSN